MIMYFEYIVKNWQITPIALIFVFDIFNIYKFLMIINNYLKI